MLVFVAVSVAPIRLRHQPLESSLGRVPQAADFTCKKFRKSDRAGRRGLSEPREDFSRLLTNAFPWLYPWRFCNRWELYRFCALGMHCDGAEYPRLFAPSTQLIRKIQCVHNSITVDISSDVRRTPRTQKCRKVKRIHATIAIDIRT